MTTDSNLIPMNVRTKAEQTRIARQGGIASGKARRQKKTLSQIGDILGGLPIKGQKNRQILRDFGVEDEDMINDVIIMYQLTAKAMKGDAKAIETLAKIRKQLTSVNENYNTEVKPPLALEDLAKGKAKK